MMKVLIIEDEPLAAKRLNGLIEKVDSTIEVIDTLDSVSASVKWFNNHESPQLVFMDIQLADGLSFEIFNQVHVKTPVVFTTAYDEYALKAFKVNSIDYLLKPIDEEGLTGALKKYSDLSGFESQQTILGRIGIAMQMLTRKYKERFVTKVGEHLKFMEVQEILFFFTEDKVTFCRTRDNRNHILDYSLDQVEQLVDSSQFFRINRKYIIRIEAIVDMLSHVNSRIRLVLKGSDDMDVVVARKRVQDFKTWLDR